MQWPTPTSAHKGTIWAKRLLWPLRFKFVRRLIYLTIILIVLYNMFMSTVNDLFGGGSGDGGTGTGGAPPDATPITSTNPQQAITGAYNYLRSDQPERACRLFDETGQAAFSAAHGSPNDCATAARNIRTQITAPGPYANPKYGENAVEVVEPEAAVYGCRMRVDGGPLLGSFKLTRAPDGGWLISGYELEAEKCRR
ncbi:hypothetical protein [Saccharopolyspora taberi]|uniref:Nuclear transport factor 2 family protein n=1 Tax=Saccharopolyspora taberi TaxID=60895 RepID=A0ABN3VKH5_9PSEU